MKATIFFLLISMALKGQVYVQSVPDRGLPNAVKISRNTGSALPFVTLSPVPSGSSFTLPAAAKTSAGVYNTSDVLVRTLWSGVDYSAGTYTPTWDGKLDDLTTDAPAGSYTIKVVSSNITATWEGVIGNTSDSLTGNKVHRQFLPFIDMCIAGGYAYVCSDFAEAQGSTYRFSLTDIQKKLDMLPHTEIQQTTDRICTDGVRLYRGGNETQNGNKTYVEAVPLANLPAGDYSNHLAFQGETVQTFGATYKAVNVINNANRITGLAVQVSGNWLFVARRANNTIHVIHKTTGVIAQTLTFTAPTVLAIDGSDNLWVAYNGTVLEKFSVNSGTGALTTTSVTVSGLTNVQGLTVSPDGTTITVADAGTYHQVKGYSNTTGSLSWTLGQSVSYSTDATVANDKFYFTDQRGVGFYTGFVAYESDGSLWVGDYGNYRYLKFNSSRNYVTQVAFLPHCWSSYVCGNDPTRVFADYLEYDVDYSLPIQLGNANGAWTLVKNWGFNVPLLDDGTRDKLRNVTTLSNGRTYALLHDEPAYVTWQIVELVAGGALRFTGVTIPRYNLYQLKPDGSVIGFEYISTNSVWKRKTLTGFDGSNNLTFSAFSDISIIPTAAADPIPAGDPWAGEITSTNILVSFKGDLTTGYHLGGIDLSGTTTSYKWKTAKTVNTTAYVDPFPPTGEYDIGSNVQYGGSTIRALDRIIIWGYNGEFWRNSQTNKWNIVYDNGLFIAQFGIIPDQVPWPPIQAEAKMAGNAFKPSFVKVGSDYYLWHNDESFHGGLHRWKITGLGSIQEHSMVATLP